MSLNDLADILKRLIEKSPNRIALVGTPPPKKDNDALREMMQAEPFFVEQAQYLGQPLETIIITAPHVRLKLWHVLQDMLAEQAREISGIFIPVSPETQEDEGYLRPDLWAPDLTHANDLYGRIMLQAALRMFD